jgi:hypothetical protein
LVLGEMPVIGFAGGVLHGSQYFRELVEAALVTRRLTDPGRSNLHLVDGIDAGVQFASRLATAGSDNGAGPVPDGLVISVKA